ncbi:hypothetical protein BKA62DRAFT_824211 [Auriculariales sp. MPI-PUGE-AT-0066]|nr:hypothetical protein BKA62DRAFT_824211 [Auriculariales sp. MPI-PUGE-AT-0066]
MALLRHLTRSFSLPPDPEDISVRRQLNEKVIPWSRSPFDDTISDADAERASRLIGEEEESDHNSIPGWIELFFDLSWTMTFSGLTGNTPIKDSGAVQSYIVFFILAWWLWVQQVVYDTRFYTNDHFHRSVLVMQFLVFVSLASFTSGFNIYRGIVHTPETDVVSQRLENRYLTRSFEAIAIIFGLTRFILAGQYIRVAYFKRSTRTKHVFRTITSLIVSGLLFFISFFVIMVAPSDGTGGAAHTIKFILWFLGIVIEIGVYLAAEEPYGLIPHTSMLERLGGLTTIIIGESLNGLIDPLVNVAKSIGFNGASAFQIITVALAVFLVFMLYFASFDLKAAVSPLRQKLAVFAHFPLFICIVLLIEGMKGVMTALTFLAPFSTFSQRFGDVTSINDLRILYGDLGLDFTQTFNTVSKLDNGADPTLAGQVGSFRLAVAGLLAIAEQFEVLSEDAVAAWTSYLTNQSPNELLDDFTSGKTFLNSTIPLRFGEELLGNMQADLVSPLNYISIVGGCLLLCLLLLMLLTLRRTSKYAGVSTVCRVVLACGMFATIVFRPSDPVNSTLPFVNVFLPVVAGIFALELAVDYVIYWFMARNLKRRGLLSRNEALIEESKTFKTV